MFVLLLTKKKKIRITEENIILFLFFFFAEEGYEYASCNYSLRPKKHWKAICRKVIDIDTEVFANFFFLFF